jgi:hypothetical protein
MNVGQADARWSWREGKDTTDWSAQFESSLRTHNDMDTSTLCNVEYFEEPKVKSYTPEIP